MSSLACCTGGNKHYAEVEELRFQKCRKPFNCQECDKPVVKGEEYARYTTLYDGYWDHIKVCEPCWMLGESMAALDFCWELGGLREAHQEYLREYAPPKLERRVQ